MGATDCKRCGGPLVKDGGGPLKCAQCGWQPGDPTAMMEDLKILQKVPTNGGLRERVKRVLGWHQDTYLTGESKDEGTGEPAPVPPRRKRVQL